MKALCKTLVLLLATAVLASCGGGGGGSNSAFEPVSQVVTVTAAQGSITTNSFTSILVSVKQQDGAPAPDGEGVNLTLSPLTMGTVSGPTASGTTATSSTSGGTASFVFNSSNQTGTAHLIASVTVIATGSIQGTYTYSGATDVTVTGGNTQDPRIQLTASTTTLPLNPLAGEAEDGAAGFPNNYPGSPYIAEVTVTRRHSNGSLVSGSELDNASIDFTNIATFSLLDDGSTPWTGETKTPPTAEGNEFLTLLGSGPVTVTGGNGVIFVHAGDVPGHAVLTVTAVDPDSGQTISSQLAFTVAGASSGLPSSIVAISNGGAYISGSNGPQSTVITAEVFDGSDALVADPSGFDNVQFQIAGPANSDARLVAIDASGHQNTGTTVLAATHNGVATATFQAGTQQGPVQVKMTADRADNNVDNGITDPVTGTTTVVVSDGKLFSLTIDSPSTDTTTGVSNGVVENPTGSGNYELTISARAVDRQGNFVLPSSVIAFGDVDSPQVPSAASPQSWFQISGSHGDPQEGGNLFTATDGRFTTAGGGAGPGDTLLVIGKANEGAPAGNDDLETSAKITAILSSTSLTVAAPFNLNDTTGVSVDNHAVLPYIIGRAEFSDVQSPVGTISAVGGQQNNVFTVLSYSGSEIGKAVAVWAQGTSTDTEASPGLTKLVADVRTLVLPGLSTGAIITASPDPLLGNASQTVTVCYYDGNNRPIPNFDINFSFALGGTGTGSVDGVANSGKLKNLTGSNGCAIANVTTSGLAVGSSTAEVTFSGGAATSGDPGPTVSLQFVVNVGALQVAPCQFKGSASPQTVTIKVVDGAGNGVSGQSVTAACTVLSGTGSISASSGLGTDASGITYSVITVTPADDTSVVGYCTFTSGTLVQSVGVNTGSCSTSGSGGFSPLP